MSGRGLDHLIEQNETDLGFLSAYGGGETSEELLNLIQQAISEEMQIEIVEEGISFILHLPNLPLVASDIERRGFLNGKLTSEGVEVTITDYGPEQRRFIERLVEFIQSEQQPLAKLLQQLLPRQLQAGMSRRHHLQMIPLDSCLRPTLHH